MTNVKLPAQGTGDTTPTVATDTVAGIEFQKVKLVDGTAGSTTGIPGGANGLKVDPSGVTSPVSAASLPLPTGAATEATLAVLKQRSATSAVAQVASSASNVTLQASNANRLGLMIVNDSTSLLYVKFGTTASPTSYTVQMTPGAYYEVPFGYTGKVDGIWATANGNAYCTELTA